jgi:hypothetical protein
LSSQTSQRANLAHTQSVASFTEQRLQTVDPTNSEGFDWNRLYVDPSNILHALL